MPALPQFFRNSHNQPIPYDGSPVTWRVSVYGVCLIGQEVLLIKQTGEEFWDLPGGGVEMGEELAEALIREGLEEAGWQLQVGNFLSTETDWFYHAGEKKFYRTLQLFWRVTGQQIASPSDSRINQVKLFPIEDALRLPIFAGAKQVLVNLLHK